MQSFFNPLHMLFNRSTKPACAYILNESLGSFFGVAKVHCSLNLGPGQIEIDGIPKRKPPFFSDLFYQVNHVKTYGFCVTTNLECTNVPSHKLPEQIFL